MPRLASPSRRSSGPRPKSRRRPSAGRAPASQRACRSRARSAAPAPARRRLGDLVDIDFDAPAAPPPRVDQLVAGDRIEPRRHRRIGPPGVAFHVNGQQRFLHDVLRIDAALPGRGAGQSRAPGRRRPAGRPCRRFRRRQVPPAAAAQVRLRPCRQPASSRFRLTAGFVTSPAQILSKRRLIANHFCVYGS